MFGGLGYCTRFEHLVLKVLHDGLIMVKESKICRLYILYGSIAIVHASLAKNYFHDNSKLWDLRSIHVNEKRIDKGPKVSLEHFNDFF